MTQEIIGASNRVEANPGTRVLLTDSAGAALDANVLPSSAGTWILSQVYNIRPVRTLLVEVQYDGNAATVAGYPSIRPLVCAQARGESGSPPVGTGLPPLATDDVWMGLTDTGGVVTATAQPGTKATGLVEAHGPLQGYQKGRGLVWEPPGVVANSGKLRESFMLKVDVFSWIMFEVAEAGDVANRGKLRLYLTGSA